MINSPNHTWVFGADRRHRNHAGDTDRPTTNFAKAFGHRQSGRDWDVSRHADIHPDDAGHMAAGLWFPVPFVVARAVSIERSGQSRSGDLHGRRGVARRPPLIASCDSRNEFGAGCMWGCRRSRRSSATRSRRGCLIVIWGGQAMNRSRLTNLPNRPNNLWEPVSGDHGAHDVFNDRASDHSLQLWADMALSLNRLMPGTSLALVAADMWMKTTEPRSLLFAVLFVAIRIMPIELNRSAVAMPRPPARVLL